MKYFYSFVIVGFIFNSCSKDSAVNSSAASGYSYFPLSKGSWIIYNADSVIHLADDDLTNQPDTSIATYHFQIKEVVDDDFIDGQGNKEYRILRYRRSNDTLPWEFLEVWVASRISNSAQRVEDNIRYVKLSFPVNIHSTWNGNAFNNFFPEDYSYTDVHVSSTIGTLAFDSVATVLQLEDNNLLHRIFKQEKYASHVGLVYRQSDSLNINGIGQVTNGIEFKETIQSYGN